MTREEILNWAITAPAEIEVAPGIVFRRTDLFAEMMCSRVGVSLPIPTETDGLSPAQFPQLAEFIFIHAAPRETVEKIVYETPSKLAIEADRFFAEIPQEKIERLVEFIYLDASAKTYAQAKVLPDDKPRKSKNAQIPAAPQG